MIKKQPFPMPFPSFPFSIIFFLLTSPFPPFSLSISFSKLLCMFLLFLYLLQFPFLSRHIPLLPFFILEKSREEQDERWWRWRRTRWRKGRQSDGGQVTGKAGDVGFHEPPDTSRSLTFLPPLQGRAVGLVCVPPLLAGIPRHLIAASWAHRNAGRGR